MALTRVGGDLLKQPLNIGTGVTITPDGNATFAGIVTAANLVDAAGNPITGGGAAVGLGTVIVEGSTVGGEQIYYTNTTLTITGDLTVNPPDSSNIAYTQYSEIAVEQGYDLIVEDGDDLIPDILGLSTETAGVLPGAGGRVRADQFTNKAGTGAPEFPNGALVSGDFTVTGSKTYLNSDSVEFKDKNIGIASATTKLTDAQLNGAGFTIYGLNSDKSLTWDNPNDRMAFSTDLYAPRFYGDGSQLTGVDSTSLKDSGDTIRVQANTSGAVVTGVLTSTSSITVGDAFIKAGSVGVGTTTTVGRDAGISTAVGSIIYIPETGLQIYTGDNFGWKIIGDTAAEFSVTGGTIDTVSRSGYTIHTFSGSANPFVVNGGTLSAEILVVAGGGGGSSGTGSAGAGAGGLLYSNSVPLSPGTYIIQVGAGGAAAASSNSKAFNGVPSYIMAPTVVGFTSITALGGGAGALNGTAANPGGSGGGAAGATVNGSNRPNGTGDQSPSGGLTGYGNAGGTGTGGPTYIGSGGGGAGAVGGDGSSPGGGGAGGNGLPYSINGTPTTYAGGGGGGMEPNFPATTGLGGSGGGGNGGSLDAARVQTSGAPGTGGGAGGNGGNQTPFSTGGSGIVIIAYPNS